MTLEVAIPTEEPQANIVEVTPPSLAIKQYSSSKVSSINLLKNCLGAGVFSLNARVSAISANPVTIVPAAALVFTMAMWATYNFYMVSYLHYKHRNTSLSISNCVPITVPSLLSTGTAVKDAVNECCQLFHRTLR